MTHDAETKTAAAVIEDLLYLIPAHSRRSDKLRRRKRLGRGRASGTTIATTARPPALRLVLEDAAGRGRRSLRPWDALGH